MSTRLENIIFWLFCVFTCISFELQVKTQGQIQEFKKRGGGGGGGGGGGVWRNFLQRGGGGGGGGLAEFSSKGGGGGGVQQLTREQFVLQIS